MKPIRLVIRTKLLLLAGIPVLASLILAGLVAQHAWTQTAAAAALGSIEDVAALSVRMSEVLGALQNERAYVAIHEGSELNVLDDLQEPLTGEEPSKLADKTSAAWRQLEEFLAARDLSKLPTRLAEDIRVFSEQLQKRTALRTRMEQEPVPVEEILTVYGRATSALLSATAALTELSDDGVLLRSISSLVALSQLTERFSREHALVSFALAAGAFPPGTFKTFVTLMTEQDVYGEAFIANSRVEQERQYRALQASEPVREVRAMRAAILDAVEGLPGDPHAWFHVGANKVSQLQHIEQTLLGEISSAATRKLQSARRSVQVGLWLSVGSVLLSGLLAWLIARGITRSVTALSSTAAQVRETKNYRIRAAKTSADELGTLADTFNEMLSMIEARDAHLEAQVAERTEELRRTVAELWSEMDLARKIQTVLLPQKPSLPEYRIAAQMMPAATVGGDYYDAFSADGTDWLLIGDVSGHGVTAGLTMMIVQTAVHSIAQNATRDLTPSELLTRVNAAIRSNLQKIDEHQYVTITALRLSGSEVVYAGLHQDILVYRARTKSVERHETQGAWLGLLDDLTGLLQDDRLLLEDGDLLLFYTDGITELELDGELLGTERLATMFERLATKSPEPNVLVEQIVELARKHEASDDVTVLVARYEAQRAS